MKIENKQLSITSLNVVDKRYENFDSFSILFYLLSLLK